MPENDKPADERNVLEKVRDAFRAQPALRFDSHPLDMAFEDGTLLLGGEVPSVAAKRLALEGAAAIPGVTGILDRLRVAPSQRMSDTEIGSNLRDHLVQEPAFQRYVLRWQRRDGEETLRQPDGANGTVSFSVEDGVVTLNGEVQGLEQKRLAGLLSWWVPGTRDVINGLVVEPEEEDSAGALTDAVRTALEKDPFVDASQIRIVSHDAVVLLEGLVSSPREADMAEADAWYVFGVDKVINKIEARP